MWLPSPCKERASATARRGREERARGREGSERTVYDSVWPVATFLKTYEPCDGGEAADCRQRKCGSKRSAKETRRDGQTEGKGRDGESAHLKRGGLRSVVDRACEASDVARSCSSRGCGHGEGEGGEEDAHKGRSSARAGSRGGRRRVGGGGEASSVPCRRAADVEGVKRVWVGARTSGMDETRRERDERRVAKVATRRLGVAESSVPPSASILS